MALDMWRDTPGVYRIINDRWALTSYQKKQVVLVITTISRQFRLDQH
jgi:hypothetical protein